MNLCSILNFGHNERPFMTEQASDVSTSFQYMGKMHKQVPNAML